MARSTSLSISIAVGLVSFAACWLWLWSGDLGAADFSWAWRGARLLAAGQNPYATIVPTGSYPYDDYLYYPLPALLYALPLSLLPASLAGALFIALSSALLAYGAARQAPHRLLLFASAPYLYALFTVQWAPLVVAAALLPALGPALLAKPNIGLPLLLAYPRRGTILACLGVLALSLLVLPSWPSEMLTRLGKHLSYVPLVQWFGPALLLALAYWRMPEGRLLLGMALVPQRLLYDQLGLWLIPQSARQSLLLSASSWLGFCAGLLLGEGRLVLAFLYLPALVFLLVHKPGALRLWPRLPARRT